MIGNPDMQNIYKGTKCRYQKKRSKLNEISGLVKQDNEECFFSHWLIKMLSQNMTLSI